MKLWILFSINVGGCLEVRSLFKSMVFRTLNHSNLIFEDHEPRSNSFSGEPPVRKIEKGDL
jgi:hypothetical protein